MRPDSPLETESLAEDQSDLTASLANQISWTILKIIIIEQSTADAIFSPLEKKSLVWKFSRMRGESIVFFIIK